MGDWVRALLEYFFLLYFFLHFYDTRLVDVLTYPLSSSLFQLQFFVFVSGSYNCSCPVYYYVGASLIYLFYFFPGFSGSRGWLVRNVKVKWYRRVTYIHTYCTYVFPSLNYLPNSPL